MNEQLKYQSSTNGDTKSQIDNDHANRGNEVT